MGRRTEWQQVPSKYAIEITPELLDSLPAELRPHLEPYVYTGNDTAFVAGDLVIEFEASGCQREAQVYGDPYNCYPAEFEDERELVQAYIEMYALGKDQQWHQVPDHVELNPEIQFELFKHFYTHIEKVRINV